MPSSAGSKTPLVSTFPVESLSMTSDGGTRPPVPTTVAAGSAFPLERTVTDGEVISVVVRFAVLEPPGRNSTMFPLTSTESPTVTLAAPDEPKTKRPSDVSGSPSASGSWK
jgi:hypothetical protein